MAAAPQYGTMTVLAGGIRTPIDIYISDVVDAAVRFDNGRGAGAATPDYFTAPTDLAIVDISVPTGLTDTTKIQPTVNNKTIGAVVRYANQLNTLAYRVPMNLRVFRGQTLRFIQLGN